MRRQDIQLMVSARQGDIAARCEVGRRYLLGVDGFPHHVATGVEYLNHPSVRDLPQAARLMAEHLSLEDLLRLQLEPALERAAAAGSAVALLKLALVRLLLQRREAEGLRCMRQAAEAGSEPAARALRAMSHAGAGEGTAALLRAVAPAAGIDATAILRVAALRARDAADLATLQDCLQASLALAEPGDVELEQLVADAVRLAEDTGHVLQGLPADALRQALESRANKGDREAAYALGRGLCGIAIAALDASVFEGEQNMRKGAAYLLRAADAGCDAAWLHLYRLHADHRLSVANPQMARYFLEKAAARGQAEAQRKLGALMLRDAMTLPDTEQAIHWLHLASGRGDGHAHTLLASLVLPVTGSDEEAARAIDELRADHPWLAARLELARCFGLTKLEALSVDPVEGQRPWGLVVGRNPFVTQTRLAAPRAVPALDAAALDAVRRAAALFGQSRQDALALEGDLRRRSLRQRRAFERLGLDEAMFFAEASASTLEALRLGSKWAFREREPLGLALAA